MITDIVYEQRITNLTKLVNDMIGERDAARAELKLQDDANEILSAQVCNAELAAIQNKELAEGYLAQFDALRADLKEAVGLLESLYGCQIEQVLGTQFWGTVRAFIDRVGNGKT